MTTVKLLDFDGCDAIELLADGFRVVLADVFLQGLRSSVDQVLGFLQAEGGDFADSLDGVDLVRAGILEDDGELGLLFGCCASCCTAAGCRGCCNGCCRGDAEAALKLLDQLGCFEQAEANDL